ncbi:flagellar biosynthetic protein FliQ [Chitinimonas lacunae]|uniref:Flagellar biosynthetic protein FliQ n=1 Tax=Chitinimonas lacunae TaxID=1963018 RepID=A0ABV8MVQ1_9NEIS
MVDQSVALLSELLWNGLLISAPVLLLTMLVGLLINIVQVVTQIQDMSLTFVPKILVAAIVLVTLGPWMLRRLLSFATQLIGSIPTLI